jgi:hypothetical protein
LLHFFCKKWTLLKRKPGSLRPRFLWNLLIGFRPAAWQVERDEGAQELPDPLSRLGADAFNFGEVAVELTAFKIKYDFVILHDYLN